MKKIMSLVLVIAMCLSLCACGATLPVADVEEALADCDGTLNLETSGDGVKSFTFVAEGVNAKSIVDKEYTREAITTLMTGDFSKITVGQINASKAIYPVMCIDALLNGDSEDFDSNMFVEDILNIICDGNTAQYDGWKVSAVVDQENNSITITVSSK